MRYFLYMYFQYTHIVQKVIKRKGSNFVLVTVYGRIPSQTATFQEPVRVSRKQGNFVNEY